MSIEIANEYSSPAQRIRVMTEEWVSRAGFCPICGNCSEEYEKDEFLLEDAYAFEGHLQAKHPSNNNVRAKIRQQLQSLRDKDVIQFLGRGRYRRMN